MPPILERDAGSVYRTGSLELPICDMWKKLGFRSYATTKAASNVDVKQAAEGAANIRTTNALKKAQLDLKKAYQEYDDFKKICEKKCDFPSVAKF